MSEINETQLENKKNKFLPFLLIGGLVALSYIFYNLQKNSQIFTQLASLRNIAQTQTTGENEVDQELIQQQPASLFFVANEAGQTPFYLLRQEAEVEYDQYDFGVFVSSINGHKSTNEYYWAVYVNGEYAQEASDRLVLQTGDQVEWRWEEVKAFE